jgi:hypothetical protein
MLWRVFTTRLDAGTYGDLIAHTNMHATFELHEQPNDQFKVTMEDQRDEGENAMIAFAIALAVGIAVGFLTAVCSSYVRRF